MESDQVVEAVPVVREVTIIKIFGKTSAITDFVTGRGGDPRGGPGGSGGQGDYGRGSRVSSFTAKSNIQPIGQTIVITR